MNELTKIVEAYQKTDFEKQRAALATVVRVLGSSYRSPGARMYITDDGRWVGSISGGCLEGDALRKARKVMESGIPQMITYDTMDDDNNSLGVGLGCNGIIHILLEPIRYDHNPIDFLLSIYKEEKVTSLATVFESEFEGLDVGSKFWLTENTDLTHITSVEKEIYAALDTAMETNSAEAREFTFEGKHSHIFIEVFQPPIDLLIFGGGYDAQPVANFAHQLGWNVTILDECVAHLIPINFPNAQLSGCQRHEVTTNINVKQFSAAVLMSHNYYYDLEVLKQLLPTTIQYIGILGPKKKGDKMFEELASSGIKLTAADMDRIHNPIGLDIGADTPEEIAFSIIAEIKAKFSSRSSGFLKYKTGPIHDKDPKSGEVFKQVYINTPEIKTGNA
jgi:xanthine dehydrogenase accessory factor